MLDQALPGASPNRSHRLRSLSIVGGFLDGLDCDFADGLNCFIGGRGTGKTTALELVRYALDAFPREGDVAALRRRVESLVERNLAGGRVRLTIVTRDGLSYVVSRAAGEEPMVLSANEQPTGVTLKSGAFFRADVYSQNEVESIADDSVSQLRLLDNFESERIGRIESELRHIESTLSTNALRIRPLRDRIGALTDEVGALPGVEERLKAFAETAGEDAETINEAHARKSLRDREMRAVEDVREFLEEYRLSLLDLTGGIEARAETLFSDELLDGPNAKLLAGALKDLSACGRRVDELLNKAAEEVAEERDRLQAAAGRLALEHDKQELEFRGLIEKHQQVQTQTAERTRLERLRNDLLLKRRELQEAQEALRRLLEERRSLLQKLSELRDERFAVRQAVADKINAALSPAVRVRLVQFGNPELYQRLLEGALRGAAIKHNVVAEKVVNAFWPAGLSEAVARQDARSLVEKAGLNESQAEKVIATLAGSDALFDLEAVELLDRPYIELKDGDQYKDLSSLSTGQKCTAVLPILLLYSENPLLVDQPEDNLDNRFIYETVVRSIRDVKKRRQLIFVTHNPNIPVLGDAEKLFVLESDGRSGRKANEGTVDECKADVVTLLEGGEEAFRERERRYSR